MTTEDVAARQPADSTDSSSAIQSQERDNSQARGLSTDESDAAESPPPTAADGPDAAAEQATPAPATSPPRRRVQLMPKVDPEQFKAVPSIAAQRTVALPENDAPSDGAPVPQSASPAADAASADQQPAASDDSASSTDEAPPESAYASSADVSAPTDADALTESESAPEPPPAPRAKAVEIPEQEDLDAQMEAEIAAALESGEVGITPGADPNMTAEELAAPPAEDEITEGSKLKGTVQAVDEENVFLDFGLRTSGVASLRLYPEKKRPSVGDVIEVLVSSIDEEEGLIICTPPRSAARVSGDWDSVAPGQVIECVVSKTNKGGLEVAVGTLRGFMPASQVDLGFVGDLETFVGQKVRAKITEVKPSRRRLVVSRKAILLEEREVLEKELLQELEPGQTRTGRVKTLKEYGAFIDLGGMDGFLHIGQISWNRIDHPNEVLTEGQEVEVKVLTLDPESKKISLSMRQLEQNPWSNAEMRYPKGSTVSGVVTRTEPFGAFVELEAGVEGLVHISELDHAHVKRVDEILKVGQHADLQVLEVDPKRRRIGLSLKALKEKPADPSAAESQPDVPAYERKTKGPLKGGIGGEKKGGLFGDPQKFT